MKQRISPVSRLTAPLTCLSLCLSLLVLASCQPEVDADSVDAAALKHVDGFLDNAQDELLAISKEASTAQWAQATNITDETTQAAAAVNEKAMALSVRLAKEAAEVPTEGLPGDSVRKLTMLRSAITLPAPSDDAKRSELSQIAAKMEADYGSGKYCPNGEDSCRELEDFEDVIDQSRDPDALLDAWTGWREVFGPMRADYQRFAELGNEGAKELGYSDLGTMWRSKYDMNPDAFANELDRLWGQVRPLYEKLHCHVRAKLSDQYGDLVPEDGPIPAHLLGNMWAQSWGNIYDLVAPPSADPGFDLTEILRERGVDEREMVRIAENFFKSLGFGPLPDTFWERSLFEKPDDRAVMCHASAWHMDLDEDVRLKQCIQINGEDFSTVHHELGHSYYQLAYREQPLLYRDSANDGFHEAAGDTLALSITPKYLVDLGFIDAEPPPEADLGLLMRMALDKVAFLPFGLLVDQWRWGVFSGDISTEEYNQAWWDLREKYQGIAAPAPRSESNFDPGAKYHVPANTPYTRYFLAHILQFQFHRELCEAAGYEGPLNRCSIYGNEAAGERLRAMMASGASRPWPEALAMISGEEGEVSMDASAILDYFAPLSEWLDEQNAERTCGW